MPYLLAPKAFEIGSDILYLLGPKQVFADAVTRENTFWRLLHLLERPEANESVALDVRQWGNVPPMINQRKDRAWSILEALSSSPSIADAILSSSSWIELLGVLVGYAKFTKLWTARVGAAKTLSRLLWDPKTGAGAGTLLFYLLLTVFQLPSLCLTIVLRYFSRFFVKAITASHLDCAAQRRPRGNAEKFRWKFRHSRIDLGRIHAQ